MRPICEIVGDIIKDWKKPYFGAVPYINAMRHLNDINQNYGVESAKTIIEYFLVNASAWRGPEARKIKAELNKMIK